MRPSASSQLDATKRLIANLHPSEHVRRAIEEVVFSRHVLKQAAVPELLQRWLNNTFKGTWFTTLPGAGQIIATATGSKPGDPLADRVFQFAVSAMTVAIVKDLKQAGICECLRLDEQQRFATQQCCGDTVPDQFQMHIYIYIHIVSWADGLALAFSAESPDKVHDRMSERGPGSQSIKRQILMNNSCLLPVPLSDGASVQLPIVRSYRHLGASIAHTNSLHFVVQERVAASEPTFRGVQTHLLRNPFIPNKASGFQDARFVTAGVRQ